MDLSENAKRIVSNASEWTFSGDCFLLEFMKEISENLEQRALQTSEALQEMKTNMNRTSIALDNAANSLTSLASMQFVENRCQDDDNIVQSLKTNEINENLQIQQKTPNETIQKFLRNNLHMLHNRHEKFSLDMDDSDDEDNGNNFVYQPKNPYNERLLPHIYGSKPWQENWHVGLRDDINNYSGDENEEEFSESDSSSSGLTGNSDTSRRTTDNISGWASANDGFSANIAAESACATSISREPISQPIASHNPALPVLKQDKELGSFNSNYETPSTASIPSFKSNLHHKSIPIPRTSDSPPPLSNSSEESLKRKTVNLFDDEDFNSFMAEITEKVTKPIAIAPVAAARRTASFASGSGNQNLDGVTIKNQNLFENTTEVSLSPKRSQAIPTPQKQTSDFNKTKSVNLFDSPEASPSGQPLFPSEAQPVVNQNHVSEIEGVTMKNQDLFEYPSEESMPPKRSQTIPTPQKQASDFNKNKPANLFDSPKASPLEQSLFSSEAQPVVNLSHASESEEARMNSQDLFDYPSEVSINPKRSQDISTPQKRSSDFNKTKPVNLFDSPEASPLEQALFPNTIKSDEVDKAELGKTKITAKSLFDDDDDDDDFLNVFGKKEIVLPKPANRLPLFDDDSDLVSTGIPTTTNSGSPLAPTKAVVKEVTAKTERRSNLFEKQEEKPLLNVNRKISLTTDSPVEVPALECKSAESDESLTFAASPPEVLANKAIEFKLPTPVAQLKNPESPVSGEDTEENSSFSKLAETSQSTVKQMDHESAFSTKSEDHFDENSDSGFPQEYNKGSAPPTNNSQYSALFLDEPPDDDEFFQSLASKTVSSTKSTLDLDSDFYEPALPKVPQKSTVVEAHLAESIASPSLSKNYGGLLGLFDDVPPDDDNVHFRVQSPPATSGSNKLHNVFYDDFKETMEAVRIANENPTPAHNIFDDEPPQDVESPVTLIKAPEVEVEAQKTIHQSAKDQMTASVECTPFNTDNFSQSAEKPESEASIPSKVSSRVGKLDFANININVQALLPNASGKLNYKKPTEATKTTATETERQRIPISSAESTAASITSTMENILPNVCKTRVRVPPNRRPSTRKARQESYRKSLLENQQEVEHQVEKDNDVTIESPKPPSTVHQLKSEPQDEMPSASLVDEPPPLQTEAQTPKIQNKLSFSDLFADNERSLEDEDFFLNKSTLPKTPTAADLFSSSPPDDLPFVVGGQNSSPKRNQEQSPQPRKEAVKPAAPADHLSKSSNDSFLSNLSLEPPDDLFPSNFLKREAGKAFLPERIIDEKEEEPAFYDCRSISAAEQSGNMQSAYKDEIKEAEVVRIPPTVAPEPVEQATPPLISTAAVRKPIKLFDESNDEEDDLFGTTSVITRATKIMQRSTISKTDKQETFQSKIIAKPSLFGDEQNDSDDDLFASSARSSDKIVSNVMAKPSSIEEKSVQKTVVSKAPAITQKSGSLFGSDNDSDEEFLSALKKVEKKKNPATANKSLFSDIDSDDDDDLFGSGAGDRKQTGTANKLSAKTPVKPAASVPRPDSEKNQGPSAAGADNPLADLLGN